MSLEPLDVFGICAGGCALLGGVACVVSAIVYRDKPMPPAEPDPRPRTLRARIKALQIVPKAEAHTLPRYLRKH